MRFLAIGFAAFLGSGCASDNAEEITVPISCSHSACKLEGSQIGQEGATIRLDRGTATFVDWIPKAGDPGKYVGFTIKLEGIGSEVWYRVKSGEHVEYSAKTSWKHLGADCQGIDDVDFGAGVASDDPSGGGGGGGCDNPDGCPDQGSGQGPFL